MMVLSAKGVVLSMLMESTDGVRLSMVFVVLSLPIAPWESVADAIQVMTSVGLMV